MHFNSNISLRALEVFCLVVQLRSVTKAAQYLGIAQPAATAQLRHLETKLGINLVRKQGRSLELTDGGEQVYRWAREIMGRSEELSREILRLNEGQAGTVTIAATMSVGSHRLAEIVSRYQTEHPHTRIVCRIMDSVHAMEVVRTGTCDFGVMLLDPTQRHDELVVELIWHEPFFLLARPDSRHVSEAFGLAHIQQVPFVSAPVGFAFRSLEDDLLRTQGITKRNVSLEFSHPEAIKQAILMDAAIGFLQQSYVEADLHRGDLVRLDLPEFRAFTLPAYVVHRRNKILSNMHQSLIATIRREISQGLPMPPLQSGAAVSAP